MTPGPREEVLAVLRSGHRTARRRATAVLAGGALALAAAAAASVLLGGSAQLTVREVLPALVGRGDGLADYVVFETRLPRAAGALLAGAVFGLSGALYQRVVRNPLATPDVIGVTAGASAGAVAVIVLGSTALGGAGVQLAALCGALLVVATVAGLTRRSGLDSYRVVLVGIGVGAVAVALTSYLLTLADEAATAEVLRWTTGSASGLQWHDVGVLALAALAAVATATALGRSLGALGLGDDLARGLGTRVAAVRVAALLLGAAVAALATSAVGPVGFVALVSGPVAARLVPRGPHLAVATLVGALLVLGADVAAQNAPWVSPVPTGVFTAVVGAPVFLWLLLASRPDAA